MPSGIKKIFIAVVCFIIGTIIVLPISAHVVSRKDAHTFGKKHANKYALKSWTKKYSYSKGQCDKRYYTKTQITSLLSNYYTVTQSDSNYVNTSGNETMSGELTASDFNYSSAKTKTMMIPASSVVGYGDTVLTWTGVRGGVYNSGGTVFIGRASVMLPDGATITSAIMYYYDNSSNSIMASLNRIPVDAGTVVFMANFSSSGTPGYSSSEDTSISSNTIDNSSYYYYLYITFPSADTDTIFKALKITYTVNEP